MWPIRSKNHVFPPVFLTVTVHNFFKSTTIIPGQIWNVSVVPFPGNLSVGMSKHFWHPGYIFAGAQVLRCKSVPHLLWRSLFQTSHSQPVSKNVPKGASIPLFMLLVKKNPFADKASSCLLAFQGLDDFWPEVNVADRAFSLWRAHSAIVRPVFSDHGLFVEKIYMRPSNSAQLSRPQTGPRPKQDHVV